jgi:hypothetical protein
MTEPPPKHSCELNHALFYTEGSRDEFFHTNGKERIRVIRFRKCNSLLDRAILRLHADLVIDGKLNTLTSQSLDSLLHRIQLGDSGIGHDAHPLGSHILKVHADLFSRAGTESNTRRRHFKSILLLARRVCRRGQVPADMVHQ